MQPLLITASRFVTVLATEDKRLAKPFLLRSYPYIERATSCSLQPVTLSRKKTYAEEEHEADKIAGSAVHKPKRYVMAAHNFEIWQVARAATAGRKYFRPQVLSGVKQYSLEDAGLSLPNPTKVGVDEIIAKHGREAIGVVVSVGTAKADEVENGSADQTLISSAEGALQIVTDPEPAHREVQKEAAREGFPYFRLNPEEPDHLLKIVFDEWKPKRMTNGRKPGSDTLSEMKRAFNRWYTPEIEDQFRACANELVARRRERADGDVEGNKEKWERYVEGVHFECQHPQCPQDRQYTRRDEFEQHFVVRHGRRPTLKADVESAKQVGWRYQQGSV